MKVGITTTVPVEVLLAGGHIPVDLNNIFITSAAPITYVNKAHDAGFPRSLCSWIKGQYSVIEEGGFDAIVAVTTGDCSNTQAMTELLIDKEVKVYRFAYPSENDTEHARKELAGQIERFASFFYTPMDRVREQFAKLRSVREKLRRLDDLTAKGYVSGEENHVWLVSSSDFNSDPHKYEAGLDIFLSLAEKRTPFTPEVRLGYIGVPPVITDLYTHIRKSGAEIVFNEVQRQFSIPQAGEDMVKAYLDYTYPYDIFTRIKDIRRQIGARRLHGLVHYVQSFCHRQVHDILLKKHLPVPILTIEGDSPGALDERSKIRLESFVEMLAERNKIDKNSH